MELGHLLTRSCLTYPEVSSKVYHDSFCQLGSSISLPWVIYFEAFYLHIVSSFSCIPVICPKLLLFKLLCNLWICFVICPRVSCCSSHVFHLCCCYSSGVPCLIVQVSLPYSKTRRASVLYSFILVFLRVLFCGNAIPKHAGPEAKGSNPTAGLTLLWVRNLFRGNFDHCKSHGKKPDRFSLDNMDVIIIIIIIIIWMSLVTGLFFLALPLNQRWSPPLRLQASHCSTFRIMCDVPSILLLLLLLLTQKEEEITIKSIR